MLRLIAYLALFALFGAAAYSTAESGFGEGLAARAEIVDSAD